MKKILLVLLIFIAVSVNIFAQRHIELMDDSLEKLYVFSNNNIADISNFEYKEGIALWGAYLEAGKTIHRELQFEAHTEYIICAVAHHENLVLDILMFVGEGTSGTRVREIFGGTGGDNNDYSPVFRPVIRESGTYTFMVKNSSTNGEPAFFSLVLLKQKNNNNFTLDAINKARVNMRKMFETNTQRPPSNSVPVNRWMLFGGTTGRTDNAGLINVQLTNRNFIWAGTGEDPVNNLYVETIRQTGRDTTAGVSVSNERRNWVRFEAENSKFYNLRVYISRRQNHFLFGFLLEGN